MLEPYQRFEYQNRISIDISLVGFSKSGYYDFAAFLSGNARVSAREESA
jgi:hypothetical protein